MAISLAQIWKISVSLSTHHVWSEWPHTYRTLTFKQVSGVLLYLHGLLSSSSPPPSASARFKSPWDRTKVQRGQRDGQRRGTEGWTGERNRGSRHVTLNRTHKPKKHSTHAETDLFDLNFLYFVEGWPWQRSVYQGLLVLLCHTDTKTLMPNWARSALIPSVCWLDCRAEIIHQKGHKSRGKQTLANITGYHSQTDTWWVCVWHNIHASTCSCNKEQDFNIQIVLTTFSFTVLLTITMHIYRILLPFKP